MSNSTMSGNITFTMTNVLAQSSQIRGTSSSTSLTAVFIALSIAILSAFGLRSSSNDDKVHNLGGFHFLSAWKFFTKRHDFFLENFRKTGENMFYFRLLQHRVIAMAGEANRKIFFNDAGLDMSQGHLILMGGVPSLQDINVKVTDVSQEAGEYVKQLLLLYRKERVEQVLPILWEDLGRMTNEWKSEGKINPFNEIYDLVFQMTVRMTSCDDLSEDKEAVSRLAKYYRDIGDSATPVSHIFPWFPTSVKKTKHKATRALYDMLLSYVQIRRKAPAPSMDAIDFFISQGNSDEAVVGTLMGAIFVAVINTGVNSCWTLFRVGTNPKWKRKAIDEYKALVDKYTNTTSSDPLHTRLSAIPLNAWEDELPSVDLIIRETLRLSVSFSTFRRNMGKDIQAGEATIKTGDLLVYSIADANHDPRIYANPMTFDPDRYGPGREEDKKETYGYLAWGAGRHPCPGPKVAKLHIKLVLAMMLLGYEYELVDGNDNYIKVLPEQDRNNLRVLSRPVEPCYLKYRRIVE